MRYPKDQKERSREKLLAEAGRAFRKQGYGMIGVDGLAKGANMTSGAFYVHFGSKKEAFLESVKQGLEDLRAGIAKFQQQEGAGWLRVFGDFYMEDRRTCDLAEGCALPSLSSEVERAGEDARGVYELKLREIASQMASGLTGTEAERRAQAWATLALLMGGLTMARTVQDPGLSEEIAVAVRAAVLANH